MYTETARRSPSRALASWMVVNLWVFALASGPQARCFAAGYGGGLGTAAQPYLISTAGHLSTLGNTPGDWGKCFKLTANIDLHTLGATTLKPIGSFQNGAFAGIFDGNNKTLSNLRIVADGVDCVGLFGWVDAPGARIENLILRDPNITGSDARYVGALAGYLCRGTISNCHVRGGNVRGVSLVGGLVGALLGLATGPVNDTIADCTVAATVSGSDRTGGLLGMNTLGVVLRCQAAGAVRGDASSRELGGLVGENGNGAVTLCRSCADVQGGDRVGGLIGDNVGGQADRCCALGTVRGTSNVGGLVGKNTGGTTTDGYAIAAVTGGTNVGGLVGYNAPSCDCEEDYKLSLVARCYAAGPVRGSQSGGLVGLNHNYLEHYSTVDSSFWDLLTSGCPVSEGGAGKSTAQMATLATYAGAGWDFVGEKTNGAKDFWRLPRVKSYPRLAWELTTADFNSDGRADFRDFALFAKQWRQIDTAVWSNGRYVAPDGVMNAEALMNLADLWLADRW